MSNAVFPTLPGLKWGVIKKPMWSTKVQRAASGKELRASFYSYPEYQYTLSYEVLRGNGLGEIQQLIGFFNARQGSFDSFLYRDPDDNSITSQSFGLGDGVQTKFQLVRLYGGFVEPVLALNGTPSIYVNGTLTTTGFTIDSYGLVTFTTPPAVGAVLTWTGQFYWRCRFIQDSTEFEQFLYQLWSNKLVEFKTLKVSA